MGRSTKNRISTVIVVLSLNELNGISEKVQTFKSLSSFCMNGELGAEVYIPPLSDEVVADDLAKTMGLGDFIGASNKLFKCLLKGKGIRLVHESYTIIPCHHADHVYS